MKTHAGRDKENPCIFEHTYYCAFCETAFTTDVDTHWRHPSSGRVFASLFWPACSFACLAKHADRPDLLVLDQIVMDGIATPSQIAVLWDYIPMVEPDEGDLVE